MNSAGKLDAGMSGMRLKVRLIGTCNSKKIGRIIPMPEIGQLGLRVVVNVDRNLQVAGGLEFGGQAEFRTWM